MLPRSMVTSNSHVKAANQYKHAVCRCIFHKGVRVLVEGLFVIIAARQSGGICIDNVHVSIRSNEEVKYCKAFADTAWKTTKLLQNVI